MHPIILLHGIFGFGRLELGPIALEYFGRIARGLASRGHDVLSPRSRLSAPIKDRATKLTRKILPWIRQRRAIVIAHSMGGLDARYMISRLSMDQHIAALITIATPHRGSPFADFCMGNCAVQRVGLPALGNLGLDARGGADLTTSAALRFNDQILDSPAVRYFSITTACPADRLPLVFRPSYRIIHDREGDNDGMVSIHSATWGQHLATWPVHHLHAINRRFPIDHRSPIRDISSLYLDAVAQVEQLIA